MSKDGFHYDDEADDLDAYTEAFKRLAAKAYRHCREKWVCR